MIVLTPNEDRVYQKRFVVTLPNMLPGTYSIKDFFAPDPSVPRIARKFYEDVVNGRFSNVSLIGTLSNEGYVVK